MTTAPQPLNANTPARQKNGAPVGNTNRTRHGLRGSLLPKGCRHVENRSHELRRQLEAGCIAARGEVSLTDAAVIHTATRWEVHALLAARWLRREFENLAPIDRLTFSREVAKASAERDRCIKALKIDLTAIDAWSAIDNPPVRRLDATAARHGDGDDSDDPQDVPAADAADDGHVYTDGGATE